MSLLEKQPPLGAADGMRAIACLAVIFHHLVQRLAINAQIPIVGEVQAYLLLGNTGVSIFFVLSGFLLSVPFWRNYLNGAGLPGIRHYIFRRAVRIVPAYYIVFIISLLLVIILSIPSEYLLLRSLAGLTFTSGFHYMTFFPSEINGPLWSISFEVFCYMLMPLFMLGMFKLPLKRTLSRGLIYWFVALIFILILNQLVHIYLTPGAESRGWQYGNIGGAKFWMPNYNPIGFFGQFMVGIFAAAVAVNLSRVSSKLNHLKQKGVFDLIGGLGLVLAVVLLWTLRHAPEFSVSVQQQPFFFPFFTILIAMPLAVGSHTLILQRILDNQFFRFTAKISFGLYLWHYLLIGAVALYIVKEYHYMGVTSLVKWAIISILILVVSYIMATLSYFFVEKPVLDWAHKKQHKEQADLNLKEQITINN